MVPVVIRRLGLVAAALVLGLSGAQGARAGWQYPTTPFALGAAPTGLGDWPFAVSPDTKLDWMWVGREGAVSVLSARADGSLVSEQVISLGPGAVPISVGTAAGMIVLDAANDRLLVFSDDLSTAPALSLPVDPSASALAVDPRESGVTIAVANAGS